jgi:hypothetical protein
MKKKAKAVIMMIMMITMIIRIINGTKIDYTYHDDVFKTKANK